VSSSDLKCLAVIVILAAGGYFAFFHIDWKKYSRGFQRQEPTITFVPEGAPGAKTWKGIQDQNRQRAGDVGGRLP
jgi:hypothetical protein